MKAYAVTSANVNGAFPLTLGKNASTGTSTDGTPWHQDYISDQWAWLQALLDRVGMTPSGTVEAYTAVGSGSAAGLGQTVGDGAQQHLASFARNFGGAGDLCFDVVNGTAAARRVVPVQGQVLDGYLYPDLVYNTWVGSGANGTATGFYTTSDAGGTTRAVTGLTINGVTSGRYLVLPDYRGLSPIGLGANSKTSGLTGVNGGVMVAYTGGATLGAYLADMMQGHLHGPTAGNTGYIQGISSGGTSATAGGASVSNNPNTGPPTSDGANGPPRTGLWTQTPAFACRIGIRY